MNLIIKKPVIQQPALKFLKDQGISKQEMQAFGVVHRAEDWPEVPPDYLAIATRRHLILMQLDWRGRVLEVPGEAYLLDDLRLMEVKKWFFNYSLALDLRHIKKRKKDFFSHLRPFHIEKHRVMHLAVPRRFPWNNYEELALYLMERVGRAS